MKNNISPREYEQLSAYLDGQLNERDRSRLEARLRSVPELSSALEDLRQTRTLLRSLPPMKAPRSFKLTPEMVGQTRRTRPIFPVFQFASALATLLLALVLAGDLLGFRFGVSLTANAPQAPVAMQQESAQATQVVEAPATDQAFSQLAAQPTPYPGPAAAAPMMVAPTGTPGLSESLKTAGVNPATTAEAPDTTAAGAIANSTILSDTVPVAPGTPPNGLLGAAPPTTESQRNAVRALPSEPQPVFPPVRIAEILLAVAAVSFGLTAYLLRRSSGI